MKWWENWKCQIFELVTMLSLIKKRIDSTWTSISFIHLFALNYESASCSTQKIWKQKNKEKVSKNNYVWYFYVLSIFFYIIYNI